MSTRLLYHSFGVRGYIYQHTKYQGRSVLFKIKPQRDLYVCPIGLGWDTVKMNLASGSVIFVGDGKGSEALEPFWEMLGPRRMKRIKAVGIDLGQAYTKAVEENLPDAKIVYDHFHVVKLANDALTDLRRSVHAEIS